MNFENKIKLGFTGDVSFTGIFHSKVIKSQDIFDNKTKQLLKDNDANIINFEGAIKKTESIKKGKVISNPYQSINYLKQNNIKFFNLSNNHIMDFGITGLENTIRNLDINKINYFGAGMDLDKSSKIAYFTKNNITIALIGICHVEGNIADNNKAGIFSNKHKEELKKRIFEAKKISDWVVLNYHGGAEFTYLPIPHKRDLLHEYLKYGIDIIIGNHSHVVQGYEKIKNKLIIYSLGNFVFDIDYFKDRKSVYDSIILNIEFYKNKFEFIPHFINIDCKSGLLKKVKSNIAKDNFNDISIDYEKKWEKDAYRLLFIDAKEFVSKQINGSKNLKIISFLKYVKSFCMLIKRYFKGGKNTRPIIYASLKYILKFNKL